MNIKYLLNNNPFVSCQSLLTGYARNVYVLADQYWVIKRHCFAQYCYW